MIRKSWCLFMLMASTALAQELPPKADLQTRVAAELPGFWTIDEFRVVSAANQGDPISPRAMVRFEAKVVPKADLFSAMGERLGPFDVVVKTAPVDTARTLYGTMDLSYRAGAWDGRTTVENPVNGLGQPADFFTTPVLEIGAPRQQEVMAAIKSDAVGAARAQMEAELRRIVEEGAARGDKLRAETDEALRRLQTENAERLAEAKAANAASLGDLEKEYQRLLTEIQNRFDPAVASAEEKVAAETARFNETFAAQKAEMEAAHAVEIAALTEAHAKALGELKAKQTAEYAEAEAGFAALRESLDRQIAAADDVIAKQETVIAKGETIADNKAWIDESVAKARDEGRASLEALIGVWEGTADCKIEDKSYVWAIYFEPKKIFGTGIRGTLSNLSVISRGGGKPISSVATMVHDTGNIVVPANFVVTINSEGIISSPLADLTLDARGQLRGKTRNGACAITLARKS